MTNSDASVTASPEEDRDRLRRLLTRSAFLESTPANPIMHRDGSVAPWMFYSWNVTTTADGLALAARCLLRVLDDFESTQLAGHGFTGLPLLAGCVVGGEGRYTGLSIRKERKTHLSGRRIEGTLDRARPVVVIDDSLSSGTALADAIGALEAEGVVVEGAVALVNFAGRGGVEGAVARGYRVETLFDVERDLGRRVRPPMPRVAPQPLPGGGDFPEGLHPAVLARKVAEHFLRTGHVPRSPRRVSSEDDHDGRGGVFVSFRRASDDHRIAREGHWHFGDERSSQSADIVAATIATLRAAGRAISLANLDNLKVAVTFLGPMIEILPAELDFDRWAIVVSDHAVSRAGGALPNTQVFTSEVAQYLHAWQKNAALSETSQHVLYRQAVSKAVEPERSWPSYGTPDDVSLSWTQDVAVGAALSRLARGANSTETTPDVEQIRTPICGVAVGLYRNGLKASAIEWGSGPVADMVRAAGKSAAAAIAPRSAEAEPAVAVTVLFEPESLGADARMAARKARIGRDAVRITSTGRTVTMLPGFPVYNGMTMAEAVDNLAGRAPRTATFTTYRAAQWLDDGTSCHRLLDGFPMRAPTVGRDGDRTATIEMLADYTARHVDRDGRPCYMLNVVTGERQWKGASTRQLHALMTLFQAGDTTGNSAWRSTARRGLLTYLSGRLADFSTVNGGPLADAVLTATTALDHLDLADHPAARAARRRVVAMIRPTGRVAAGAERLGSPHDFDYTPGAVLAAVAARPELLAAIPATTLDRVLSWSRNRFRVLHGWGQVGWLQQGWAQIAQRTGDDQHASFVYEIAEWAMDRQLRKNGAFLETLSRSEPSFNTGFIAEGVAAAWVLATARGDDAVADRLNDSWSSACDFMDSLTVVADLDWFVCADPAAAHGGVRLTPSSPFVRADSVSHWLHALVIAPTS